MQTSEISGSIARMGNREDLVAGAKACLFAKGYARTTVRDITAAAGGISMAAIGYHFGSKEALLNAALTEASEEWGQELARVLAAEIDPDASATQRFETVWDRVLESLAAHRQLWTATFDVMGQLEHVPRIREHLAVGLHEARLGLARILGDIDVEADPHRARVVGSFYQALLTGVMAQHLIDPENAPTGRDLADALGSILADPRSGGPAPSR